MDRPDRLPRILAIVISYLLIAGVFIVVFLANVDVDATHTGTIQTNGFDNFDNVQTGLKPGTVEGFGPFYDYSTTSSDCQTRSTFAASPPNSVQLTLGILNQGCGTFNLKPTYAEWCGAAPNINNYALGFKLRLEDSDATFEANVKVAVGGITWNLRIGSVNGVQATATGSASNVGNPIPMTAARSTWYTVAFSGMQCYAGAAYNFVVNIDGYGSSAVATPGGAGGPAATFFATSSQSGTVVYVDDLWVAGFPVASNNVVAVSNLVGFDADPFNGAIIARTSSGTNIQTFDTTTLLQRGSQANACSNTRVDGVMAYYERNPGRAFTAYLDCVDAPADADMLRIRDAALAPPNRAGSLCTDWCDIDLIESSEGGEECEEGVTDDFPEDAAQIGSLVQVPISWRTQEKTAKQFPNYAILGFAYSNNANGRIGFWVIEQRGDSDGIGEDPDKSCGLEMDFASPGTIAQICAWHNPLDGNDYVAAASTAYAVKVWKFTVNHNEPSDFVVAVQPNAPTLMVTQVVQLGPPYDRGESIACANDTLLVQNNQGDIYRVRINGTTGLGSKVWGPLKAPQANRGLAISGDSHSFAYKDGNTVKVAWTDNRTIVANLTLPAGTWKEMRLDDTATTLYVATTSNIARYIVWPYTTPSGPVPLGTRPDPDNPGQTCQIDNDGTCINTNPKTTTNSPRTGGVFKLFEDGLDNITGGFGGWLLGILFTIAPAFLAYRKFGKTGGAIAAVIGFGAATTFGFFPLWLLLVLILAAAAAVVLGISKGRGVGA